MAAILMILTTLIAMGAFYWIKSWDSTRFLPVMEVAGEETDATIGRLITCVVLFICSLASVIYAERFNKKSPDQLALPWTLATLGGTLLWVSIGECSWHFGFNVVSDEGEILFTNFPRIESIQGIPLMILTLMAIAAAWKKSILSADVLFFGVYRQLVRPFVHDRAVSDCHGLWNESGTAGVYRVSGLIHTFIFAAAGLFLILRKGTKRENRYFFAVLLYMALGTLMFGVMMGET